MMATVSAEECTGRYPLEQFVRNQGPASERATQGDDKSDQTHVAASEPEKQKSAEKDSTSEKATVSEEAFRDSGKESKA
ncbi:hypothetical protein LZ554_004216 [Drepanopeziza brunnea f. sp. 'monogermtubi']|nr:hypothetical protein LZ554_004216 [Drepanopeziza brunnea f. sp. 'monogermtubi']